MKKILVLFGTRPEVIKLVSLINALKKYHNIKLILCSTGQQREILKEVLSLFELNVDIDLDLMMQNQDLYDITSSALTKLRDVYSQVAPDYVVVQGDSTTAFVASLAAYYSKIKIVHIEAGLRSNNIYSPYPEELNRKIITNIGYLHFAPTKQAKDNLIKENIEQSKVFVTGNTVIDTISIIKEMLDKNDEIVEAKINKYDFNILEKIYILITLHRREKFGKDLEDILFVIKQLAEKHPELNFVYPVHINPNVSVPVKNILSGIDNIKLLNPLDYLNFIYLMSKCEFIMSDSGGVQEECYVFRKPIIVLRDITERNESVSAGYAFLAGTNARLIGDTFNFIHSNLKNGKNFFTSENPYGDGMAGQRIAKILIDHINDPRLK